MKACDMMECDIPGMRVFFRWGKKELEIIREKNGVVTVRANSGGALIVEPIVSNAVKVKIARFF